MTSIFNKFNAAAVRFAKEEEGAQVVEYALIIALVSIALAGVLGGTTAGGLQGAFAALVTRVGNCMSGTGTC